MFKRKKCYLHKHIHIHSYTHIHANKHTRKHTRTHIHTHTHTHTRRYLVKTVLNKHCKRFTQSQKHLFYPFLYFRQPCRLKQQNAQTASLQRVKIPPPNECPIYDIKQSDGEVPVLDLWRMRITLSLLLPPGSLWPRVVSLKRVLPMGQIELLDI